MPSNILVQGLYFSIGIYYTIGLSMGAYALYHCDEYKEVEQTPTNIEMTTVKTRKTKGKIENSI